MSKKKISEFDDLTEYNHAFEESISEKNLCGGSVQNLKFLLFGINIKNHLFLNKIIMGVRGLTTYIARHAEQYLDPFELHDSNLVIDGDNLCIQIFLKSEARTGIFGGNYDHFYRSIIDFFDLLKKCNVTPYVLLDGGYDKHKLRTVRNRLRGRISTVKYIQPGDNRLAIPLMMREVFVDAIKYCKVSYMRCLFEADNEIAVLARKLNCPVLSYDSDFYIHNVHYIPFITLTLKVYKKIIEDEKNYEIEVLEKHKPNKKIVVGESKDQVEKKTYCYLDCCLYTIENLIIQGRLEKEMLPLFATLIGNDYIERKMFRKFYSQIKICKVKKKVKPAQKRIIIILDWLRRQNLKTAIRVILKRMREDERENLLKQIQAAVCGYSYEKSIAFEFFGFKEEDSKLQDDGFNLDEYLNYDEESESELEENENEIEVQEKEDDEEEEEDEQEEDESKESECSEPEEQNDDEPEIEEVLEIKNDIPNWLEKIYQKAKVPRFIIDLSFSKLYINYPQVEDFSKVDSNEIAYPVLNVIFALVKPENHKNSFVYMTRCKTVARYYDKTFEGINLEEINSFDTKVKKNVALFKTIFQSFGNSDEIFTEINNIPENFKLYILSIIYWLKNCKETNAVHLNCLIICLLQLSVIDKKIGSRGRDLKVFHKNHDKNLNELKESYDKNAVKNEENVNLTLKMFKVVNREITKNESLLAYENLIHNFELSQKYLRKHAEFERSIAHTFAEFQAVAFNMYSLVPLLNYPFENIKIHDCYNGLYIHNMYQNFRSRSNVLEYIRNNIFQRSPNLFKLQKLIYEFCVHLVPEILERNKVIKVKSRKKNKVSKKILKNFEENDCVEKDEESDGEDFVDMNNKFYQLLKIE